MQEVAFTMTLKPGVLAEYKRRHDEIWPELSAALIVAGIRDYSIYVDESRNLLFAVQKHTPDNTVDKLPGMPVMQRWWAYMADLMETNADASPVIHPLERVFRLD